MLDMKEMGVKCTAAGGSDQLYPCLVTDRSLVRSWRNVVQNGYLCRSHAANYKHIETHCPMVKQLDLSKNGFLTNQTNISHSWFWLNSAFLRHPVHLCKSKLFSTILSSKIIMNMIGKCHTSFLFINNNILASNFNLHVCCEFDAVSMMIYVSTHANMMIVYDWHPELDRLLECVIPLAASELEKPSMHGCNIVEI